MLVPTNPLHCWNVKVQLTQLRTVILQKDSNSDDINAPFLTFINILQCASNDKHNVS